tara:strand:- start:49 stop:498 length:450 start_codon:yes stop_codon:yes gene_type:complete
MIKKFTDERGDFNLYESVGYDQVNVVTNKNPFTFRGLHYQTDPPQTKIVKVIQGKVIDFLVNLKTYQTKHYFLDKDSDPLIVPDNYAHGYLTLETDTIFTYLVRGKYNPESEHSMVFSNIPAVRDIVEKYTPGGDLGFLIISDKDKKGK